MLNRIGWGMTSVIAAAVSFGQVLAQTEFEVASVRPNKADDHIVTIHVGPGGKFDARGYTLVLLMQRAYGVMDWNVSGGPGWIRTDRFDIVAKANIAGDLTEGQLQPMLQKVLADRFKLKVHSSSREMPGYELVVARGDPKVQAAVSAEDRPDTFRMGASELSGQGITMQNFARFVGGKLGLVAVDHTGLRGLYDFKIKWKVERNQDASASPGVDPRDELRYAVFRAVEDQLGLKFVARRVTVQTLVIERAERASASEN